MPWNHFIKPIVQVHELKSNPLALMLRLAIIKHISTQQKQNIWF